MTQQESKKKPKFDPELRKKMREVEDKAREESMASLPVSQESKAEEISFDQWWILINKMVKLRPHYKEILEADFKARGLKKRETKEKYDEALKIFGIKI